MNPPLVAHGSLSAPGESDEVVIEFLSNPSTGRLLAVLQDGALRLATHSIAALNGAFTQLTYFIRPEGAKLTRSNIGEIMQCVIGACSPTTLSQRSAAAAPLPRRRLAPPRSLASTFFASSSSRRLRPALFPPDGRRRTPRGRRARRRRAGCGGGVTRARRDDAGTARSQARACTRCCG